MSDGTEEALDGLMGGEPEASAEPEGTSASAEAGEPDTGSGPQLSWVPVPLRGELTGLDPELQGKIAAAFENERVEIKKNAQRSWQEGARLRKEAKALEQKAAAWDAVQQNPDLLQRLLGLNGADAPRAPGPARKPLTEMDLSNEDEFVGALKDRLGLDRIGDVIQQEIRKALGSLPMTKEAALRESATRFWADLESMGESLTPDVKGTALRLMAEDLAKDGHDWRDIPPEQLPMVLRPWVRVAQTSLGGQSQRTKPAARAPLPTSGASVPVRKARPWEGRDTPPTPDEIWRHGGGISPEQLEKSLRQMQGLE